MKKLYILAFVCFFFCSCKKKHEQEVLVQSLVMLPLENYEQQSFDEPFFHQMHFGYPMNDHDQFGKPISDSSKFFYTAEALILNQNNQSFSLMNCDAFANSDNLLIRLSDNPFNESPFGMELIKKNSEFIIECKQVIIAPDSSARMPTFKIIKQTSFFNKENYVVGDSLKAKFTASILASYSFSNRETINDTMNVYGLIRTVVY